MPRALRRALFFPFPPPAVARGDRIPLHPPPPGSSGAGGRGLAAKPPPSGSGWPKLPSVRVAAAADWTSFARPAASAPPLHPAWRPPGEVYSAGSRAPGVPAPGSASRWAWPEQRAAMVPEERPDGQAAGEESTQLQAAGSSRKVGAPGGRGRREEGSQTQPAPVAVCHRRGCGAHAGFSRLSAPLVSGAGADPPGPRESHSPLEARWSYCWGTQGSMRSQSRVGWLAACAPLSPSCLGTHTPTSALRLPETGGSASPACGFLQCSRNRFCGSDWAWVRCSPWPSCLLLVPGTRFLALLSSLGPFNFAPGHSSLDERPRDRRLKLPGYRKWLEDFPSGCLSLLTRTSASF